MATPTKNRYTNRDEDKLREEINEQFLFAKKYLDPVHARMNQQEELYRSFIDKTNYPHGARVFDPRTFRIIETVTPRMVANEPTGSFYPQEGGDIQTTHILNALLKYDWRRADMFPKLVMFVKTMLIFGTAFGRTHWDYRTRTKTRMVPKQVNGRLVWTPKATEQIEVTEFDGPNFEVLNIYDCFPDPNATSTANMRWFIYRTFKTLKELEQENETRATDEEGNTYYKNLDKLRQAMRDHEDGKKAGDSRPQDLQYREHRRVMLSTEELHGRDESNPEFVVLRRFTREGWCDIVPEYNIVIREVENPYFHGEIPIIHGVDYLYPGELYGMGEIEPVDRLQRAVNAVLNQRLDNVQLVLRPMFKVKKTGGVDMHTLVSAPGNIITTDDMDAVDTFQIPDVTGPTFVQTMNYLTSAIQNGSGITDYTAGINDRSHTANDTATGTRLIQQEANAQFKLKIQLFNHMVIQKVANHWKDLRIQYTTDDQKLRIIGQEAVRYLVDNTDMARTDLDGQPVVPGDTTAQTKLEMAPDQSFAFLNLFPEDIQPALAGDYDFIATVSSDQLNDPIALQENFFAALDRVSNPNWVQGLNMSGKQLNYPGLTDKVFDKLQLGLESKDVLMDLQQPASQPGEVDPTQPMDPAMIDEMLAAQPENPIANPLEAQAAPEPGGAYGQ